MNGGRREEDEKERLKVKRCACGMSHRARGGGGGGCRTGCRLGGFFFMCVRAYACVLTCVLMTELFVEG